MVQHISEMVNAATRQTKSSPDHIWEQAGNTADGMDKHAFVELMNGLWAGMGRTAMPDKTTLRVWYLCLHDLTEPQFGRAIQRYLCERADEFVNVKLIRELSGAQADGDTASIAGWDEVLREIKRAGAYQTPVFADNRTAATIRHLGGWIMVCDKSPEELHQWTRQHFLKTFAAMPVTAETRLSNLIERENARTGMIEAASEVRQRIETNQEQRKLLRIGEDRRVDGDGSVDIYQI
jgi:hypothetical protein